MNARLKIIVTIVVISGLAGAAIGYTELTPTNMLIAKNDSKTSQPPGWPIDLSGITYDAKTTIPETGVTFSYPSKGYFGKGVELSSTEHFGTIFKGIRYFHLESSAPQGAQQQTDIAVYEMSDEKTLEDVATSLKGEFTDADLELGYFRTIAGTRYFLLPFNQNTDCLTAYAIVNGRLLEVTFNGGFGSKRADMAPELVTQFLEHLDFTCTSDCSVHSAPIVNMDKYRNGNTE